MDTKQDEALLALRQLEQTEAIAGLGRWMLAGDRFVASPGLAALSDGLTTARALLRRLPAPNRHAIMSAIRAARAGGTPASIELRPVKAQRDSLGLVLAIRRDDLTGIVWGVCQDVTALRRVSAELDRSESRWEMALETARQGAWDSDLVTGKVYHSRTWRMIRGMDPDGDPNDRAEVWSSNIHPDDLAHVNEQIRLQHAGSPVNMIYRERIADGSYIWISSIGAPVAWFEDGRPSRIIGTDTDITPRKLAEDEIARLSRRHALALDVTRIGVFEVNLETDELFWDERVREIYGIGKDDEIVPEHWQQFLHPDDADYARAAVQKAIDDQTSYTADFRIIRPGGEIRHLRARGTWYRDPMGAPCLLGANRDVTDEVRAQNELERAKLLAEARNVQLEAARARIEHNSLHDALTGLPNRRYLDKTLKERAERSADSGGSLGLLHIDLDRFKQINDSFGHNAGDAMLVHTAELIGASLRENEFPARIGGDEFIVVVPCSGDKTRLIALAQTLIEALEQPVMFEGNTCRFGASIGIAVHTGPSIDYPALMSEADMALYSAKDSGKNCYEVFTRQLHMETITMRRLGDELLHAVANDALLPYYQPLFDARTMRLVAVEALARWRHPVDGIQAAVSFMPIAQDLRVVPDIDRIILRKALADFATWERSGLNVPHMCLNMCLDDVANDKLIAQLEGTELCSGSLSFDLPERCLPEDLDEELNWNLDQVRDRGIGLTIDDFGTGRASILNLLRLRPSRIKIDRRLTHDIVASDVQQRLVASLIEIGHSASVQVVAEGVETLEQANILRELGCDVLQGFAFSRPMPAKELVATLSAGGWRNAS
ncbi:EAL and GGDEF domain-containing protein [Devosia sp.]|uniref:sensor domain-containing protein n=1 Tax=Devosia sp. TaxID=1871048 RepID=UPI003A9480CA